MLGIAAVGRRGLPRSWCQTNRAAPRAPPASPAAGWIQRFSKRPSRRIRPLATQFSATPPARQRFFMPVCRCTCRGQRSMTSSVTAWIEAARSMSRCGRAATPAARRAAEEPVELRVVMVSPAVVEVGQVQAGRSRRP